VGGDSPLAQLLAAAPTFRSEGIDQETASPEEAIGELVEHLGADEVRHQELSAVFLVAEEFLSRGEDEEARSVAHSLLEDVQLLASYPDTKVDAGQAASALPPRCKVLWDAIDRQWLAVWSSVGERPAPVTLEGYLRISSPEVRRLVRTSCRVMPDGRFIDIADVLRSEAGET
jgi:hypothetical protein